MCIVQCNIAVSAGSIYHRWVEDLVCMQITDTPPGPWDDVVTVWHIVMITWPLPHLLCRGCSVPSGSTLSSRSSYTEDTFSFDSLRLGDIILLCQLHCQMFPLTASWVWRHCSWNSVWSWWTKSWCVNGLTRRPSHQNIIRFKGRKFQVFWKLPFHHLLSIWVNVLNSLRVIFLSELSPAEPLAIQRGNDPRRGKVPSEIQYLLFCSSHPTSDTQLRVSWYQRI